MEPLVYYLPGAGGLLHTGLGVALRSRGFHVRGRSTTGEFRQYGFDDQTALIGSDLRQPEIWNESSRIVANSYGAYLLLNAQIHLPPYPGKVLMLSPILGAFEDLMGGRHFIPPYADRLMRMVRGGSFPCPQNLLIHTGSQDWQSPASSAAEFASITGATLVIADGRGHSLGEDYVGPVLDSWLSA